jgi:hypothetical protein
VNWEREKTGTLPSLVSRHSMGRWKEPGLEKMKVWESHWAKLERKSKLEIGLGFESGGAWETVKELLRDE